MEIKTSTLGHFEVTWLFFVVVIGVIVFIVDLILGGPFPCLVIKTLEEVKQFHFRIIELMALQIVVLAIDPVGLSLKVIF